MLIINGKLFLEETVIDNGYILIEDHKIKSIGDMKYQPQYNGEIIDAKGLNVLPGFIDQHIHGANGSDNMDATIKDVQNIAQFLPKEGTTAYLPTTMTQSNENVIKALEAIAKYKKDNQPGEAEILGIHLEGPFISEKHVGAQNPKYVQKGSKEVFDLYLKAADGLIKVVTYAPEEAEENFTSYLRENGVIPSIGHSDAFYEEVVKEIPYGLSNLTHFHNAMTPHHHRNPGAVTAGFVYPQLKAELIVDGIHLNKAVVNATYQIKGSDNIILITDAMRAKGLADGQYDLGGQNVIKKGIEARLESGALAGSVAEMDFVVRNTKNFTNAPLSDLVKMSSANSAKHLQVFDRKGSLTVNKDADIVIVNDNIEVFTTICRGVVAYRK